MKLENPLNHLVSIGIATKNRWEDLEVTLKILANSQYRELSVLILDDASDVVCPFDIKQYLPNIELKRFEVSEGYIRRRNQIARSITTKYYLSLDDDSYPVSEALEEAIEFADSHKDKLLCLSFPIYNPVLEEHQNHTLSEYPYQVRSFIGCGHLLHREHFLKIGGYSEELIHQGEEMDIAARGFQQGYYCYHFPSLQIHHIASNAGRNWHRMDYYGARNNVLWNDWFMPAHMKRIKQFRTFLSRLFLTFQFLRLGQLQGEWAGFRDIEKYKNKRSPMTADTYRSWRVLPHS